MNITGLGGEGKVAQKVINARPFDSVDDLVRVSGIKEGKLAKIKTQSLACVSDDSKEVDDEKVEEEIIGESEAIEENVEKTIVPVSANVVEVKKETEMILLNKGEVDDEELIYVSKNAKVIDYLVYVFALFLIFIIAFLIWERF